MAELIEQGHDPLEIAAVALKLARAEEKQRPIEDVAEVRVRKSRNSRRSERGQSGSRASRNADKSHEAGMVRLTLSKGKNHGIRPNDVVGTIAAYANIPGRSIGKISIQKEFTLVDVPVQYVSQVMAQKGNYQIHKQPIGISVD